MLLAFSVAMAATLSAAQEPRTDPPLAAVFREETARIAAQPLLGIETADEWKSRRPELQRKLKAMLGLDPEPLRTDLKVEIRGTVERPDFVIERLVYQSMPGLYVTANVYRPKATAGRGPAILYVCGHSAVEKDGQIIGNKAHYAHHAAWFAANGYVCLIVDTLQLGEVPGEHHGTFSKGKWWWQSRGFTPAGIEAWNAIRGIDYLISRADVDPSRLGVTGRSGGGATSWWVGAIDDRVKAVCAVAGITDLTNHVVDGVVDGHCDCMYFTNTERWDYPMLAALVAPKPLLVENTDRDGIFPEDGVRRVYRQLEKVYDWYGAKDDLSLIIGRGGHADTEELRHPAFAFFERYLKGEKDPKIVEPDRWGPIEDLKVLSRGELPPGSRNARIDESFLPRRPAPAVPPSAEAWKTTSEALRKDLEMRVARAWPTADSASPLRLESDVTRDGLRMRSFTFSPQPSLILPIWVFSRTADSEIRTLWVEVDDERVWTGRTRDLVASLKGEPEAPKYRDIHAERNEMHLDLVGSDPDREPEHVALHAGEGHATAIVAPRGIGPTAWFEANDKRVRRRFALLGQTLEGMQAYDIKAACDAMHAQWPGGDLRLVGRSGVGPSVVLAALFSKHVRSLWLANPPASCENSPLLLGLTRQTDMPELIALLHPLPVSIAADPNGWTWLRKTGLRLSPADEWPAFPAK